MLEQAIVSVMSQTVTDWECIVVDDASPIPATIPADPRITLVRHETNRGVSAAFNSGLDTASGEFVAFLADDDLLSPDRLQIALDGLAKAPISICGFSYEMSHKKGEPAVSVVSLADLGRKGRFASMGATSLRRELALRLDPALRAGEDADWWIRMTLASPDIWVAIDDRIGYVVGRHDGPRYQMGHAERMRSRLDLLERYPSYFAQNPKAAAYTWKRIGLKAQLLHDKPLARTAFLKSMRLSPSPRTLAHLVRSL
jgi:glycosyltransferase involved in cell wall biosynthesis